MPQVPNNSQDDKQEFSKDTKFYKSNIVGLSVQIGDTPEAGEEQQTVRFKPMRFFDERAGNHYVVGYLATDEQDAIEVLEDDVNAESIDKAEYEKAMKDGTPAQV